jgi:polyferredoxin
VATRETQGLSARAAAYSAVWLVLLTSVVVLFALRRDLDVLVLRQPGTLYQTVTGGDLANFYNVQAFNRTGRSRAFTIEIAEPRGASVVTLGPFGDVGPYGLVESRLMVRMHPGALAGSSTPVRFLVRADDHIVQTIDSSFLGPARP